MREATVFDGGRKWGALRAATGECVKGGVPSKTKAGTGRRKVCRHRQKRRELGYHSLRTHAGTLKKGRENLESVEQVAHSRGKPKHPYFVDKMYLMRTKPISHRKDDILCRQAIIIALQIVLPSSVALTTLAADPNQGIKCWKREDATP